MAKECTVAQRYADYRKTLPRKVNTRRLELIMKQHSGFTEEEGNRRFDEHPGWKEECERRYHVNLIDAERAELAECERIMDEWQANAPWEKDRREYMQELGEKVRELGSKVTAEAAQIKG